jgi:citrate synthase
VTGTRAAIATTIDAVLARVLGIAVGDLHDDLEYQSIWQWDSLRHVALMHELEAYLGVQISYDVMTQLRSVEAIRRFCRHDVNNAPTLLSMLPEVAVDSKSVQVHRGLEDIFIDRTTITRIDGERGTLEHRGYDIRELVEHASFEDVAYLLLHGELPTAAARATFMARLAQSRTIPPMTVETMRMMADASPIVALRTAVSTLEAAAAREITAGAPDALLAAGLELIARVPELVAMHHAFRSGRDLMPSPEGTCAERLLRGLLGRNPEVEEVRVIEQDLILHADHCANASSFAGRIAIGCRAPLHAAVTAAIATFSGFRHGGAVEQVAKMLDALDSPADARAYVHRCMDQNIPVMGFGHRVYHTEDPRVRHVRASARRLAEARGNRRDLDVIDALVDALRDYSRHGLAPNVDLYTLVTYRLLGLPDDLATSLFAAGRVVGWVAQAIEQQQSNVLIRPRLLYVGPDSRPYPRGDMP